MSRRVLSHGWGASEAHTGMAARTAVAEDYLASRGSLARYFSQSWVDSCSSILSGFSSSASLQNSNKSLAVSSCAPIWARFAVLVI